MKKLIILVLVSIVVLSSGCSYVKNRVSDLFDLGDIGVTFTKSFQFSAYLNCPTVIPVGYGKVNGSFWGIADGKVGWLKHKRSEKGFLFWGQESMSFDKFDETEKDDVRIEDTGLLGLTLNNKKAKKRPMCVHHLHVGWVGVIFNIRWYEIPDFVVGFAGFDPKDDDKYKSLSSNYRLSLRSFF